MDSIAADLNSAVVSRTPGVHSDAGAAELVTPSQLVGRDAGFVIGEQLFSYLLAEPALDGMHRRRGDRNSTIGVKGYWSRFGSFE
jgi:hypothetical protein